jgi:hypothetical protein
MVKGFFGRLDTTITCYNNGPAKDITTLTAQSHSRQVPSCSMRVLEAFKRCRLIFRSFDRPRHGQGSDRRGGVQARQKSYTLM